MNSTGIYPVMADLSPDTSNSDRLVVAVRYVDETNSPKERVLEMKEATDKTGKGQVKEILDSRNSKLSRESELVHQSYDYTASMSCNSKKAQKCLQDMDGRSIPYISCQSHR